TVAIICTCLFICAFFFSCYGDPGDLPSFPTRRSSDLDPVYAQELGSLLVPSLANGYPNTLPHLYQCLTNAARLGLHGVGKALVRSEEHTSELQSRSDLVCRLLLEKKKI